MTVYRFLCKGNEDISRSYDLADSWNGLSAESKGCNGLCATYFINFGCTSQKKWVYYSDER